MKDVTIRFIQFLDNSEGVCAGALAFGSLVSLIFGITVYNLKVARYDYEAKVRIIQLMAEKGYTEVQTVGTTATHWEKR